VSEIGKFILFGRLSARMSHDMITNRNNIIFYLFCLMSKVVN